MAARPARLLALAMCLILVGSSMVEVASADRDPVVIHRTEYGMPHIQATDYAGLGFGEGYAFALTPGGPHAWTLLTYGESEDVASPHHWDQTRRYAAKSWIVDRFTAAGIAADPDLTTTVLP